MTPEEYIKTRCCDELYGKYMDKITRVDNIYKTI